MCKNFVDDYEFDVFNFYKFVEIKLKRYQKIVSGGNKNLDFENDTYVDVVIFKIYYIVKYVQKREKN